MRDYLSDLEKLGLSDKEAKIYLVALTSGAETAQNLAKRAGVNRATAYVAINNLNKLGLVSSFNKGKKKYFIGSAPESLLDLQEKRVAELLEKKALASNLISELKGMHQAPREKAIVRYFEGKEGLKAMVKESLGETSQETLRIIVPADLVKRLLSSEEEGKLHALKVKKGIKTKVLYTKADGEWQSSELNLRKKIDGNKHPLTCDIAIYPNKVRIATLGDKISGIVIEDKNFAATLRSLFDLAWDPITSS